MMRLNFNPNKGRNGKCIGIYSLRATGSRISNFTGCMVIIAGEAEISTGELFCVTIHWHRVAENASATHHPRGTTPATHNRPRVHEDNREVTPVSQHNGRYPVTPEPVGRD